MELQAITGQLYMVAGEEKLNTAVPGLIAQAAPKDAARGREADYLFLLLSLENSPDNEPDALLQELLTLAVRSFYQHPGTTIAALRRTLQVVNQQLLIWNVANTGHSRDGALTAAVLVQGELFIAQAGHALAFMGHNFGVERLPNPASSPAPTLPKSKVVPLGRSANLNFEFNHYRLQSGDMLLLADPRFQHMPTAVFHPVLVDTEVEIGLDELRDVATDQSIRCLLVEFTEDAPLELPESSGPIRNLTATAGFTQVIAEPLRAQAEYGVRQATANTAVGAARLADGVADVMGKLRPASAPEEDPTHWAIPTAVAIIIPIIVALIFTSVFFQQGNVAEFSGLRREMRDTLTLAADAPTEASERAYYNQVLFLATEADKIRPFDNEVNLLRQEAQLALDRLDKISRLESTPLAALSEEAMLTAVVLGEADDGDIYVLDEAQNFVFRYQTDANYSNFNPEPTRVLFGGQAVGSHVVGQMQDMLWRSPGPNVTTAGLVVLDTRGALLSFYPELENRRATPLDLASEWRMPTRINTFNERLYILDASVGQIWRYYPSGEDLQILSDDVAVRFDESVDLSTAVDFDIIQEDGSVLMLFGNGGLHRYASGRPMWTEADLVSGGLDQPLIAPHAIKMVGQGLNSSLFVLDPGSARLLQFSVGGTMLAQYRVADEHGRELFARATDFAIAENPLRIFVTADNQLYLVTP